MNKKYERFAKMSDEHRAAECAKTIMAALESFGFMLDMDTSTEEFQLRALGTLEAYPFPDSEMTDEEIAEALERFDEGEDE